MTKFNAEEYIAVDWIPYIESEKTVASLALYLKDLARQHHDTIYSNKGKLYNSLNDSNQKKRDDLHSQIQIVTKDIRNEIARIDEKKMALEEAKESKLRLENISKEKRKIRKYTVILSGVSAISTVALSIVATLSFISTRTASSLVNDLVKISFSRIEKKIIEHEKKLIEINQKNLILEIETIRSDLKSIKNNLHEKSKDN